jgi:hypothetical protein
VLATTRSGGWSGRGHYLHAIFQIPEYVCMNTAWRDLLKEKREIKAWFPAANRGTLASSDNKSPVTHYFRCTGQCHLSCHL